MTSSHHVLVGVTFFAMTLAIAVLGYVIAGWSFIDALYHVIVTVSGVGYQETRPIDTVALRAFTIVVILCGTTSLGYIALSLVQLLTEGELRRALGERRMMQEIERMREHVIIVGYGRLGYTLAKHLHEDKCPALIIDIDPGRVERIKSDGFPVIVGNAEDEETLVLAGIRRARALATVLPDDAENVFITLSARNLNPNLQIIARGERRATHAKLIQAGASHVVMPAALSGRAIADFIVHPDGAPFGTLRAHSHAVPEDALADVGLKLVRIEIEDESAAAERKLSEIEARGHEQFIVVAIAPKDGETVYYPNPDTVVHPGDEVVAVGPAYDEPCLVPRQTSLPEAKTHVRLAGTSPNAEMPGYP